MADLAKTVMPGNPETSVSLVVTASPPPWSPPDNSLSTSTSRSTNATTAPACTPPAPASSSGPGTPAPTAGGRTTCRERPERGALSSLSVPLAIDVDEQVSGALDIYAREADAFDADAQAAATRFGPYAAVAAGNLHAYRSARAMADNLQAALESRAVIDQAKGVLIERYELTPDQAFQRLAEASMHANRKVRDVADDRVRTGELLVVAPRGDGKRPGPGPARGRPGPDAPRHS